MIFTGQDGVVMQAIAVTGAIGSTEDLMEDTLIRTVITVAGTEVTKTITATAATGVADQIKMITTTGVTGAEDQTKAIITTAVTGAVSTQTIATMADVTTTTITISALPKTAQVLAFATKP